MFIFPIRTDRRLHQLPWVNIGLIVANVLVFFLTDRSSHRLAMSEYMLQPAQPSLFQFISYQFLHSGPTHLLGNMLFLYVFGNSVEDRLGKVGYLAFYLAGGVCAGLGHVLVEDSPVLGASGSVAAVTGAYLALFPRSSVTLFYFAFVLIGTFEVAGWMLIVLQVAENLFFQLLGTGGVAYLAHLSGYAFGFLVGAGLLLVKLLPREPYDIIALVQQHRRRIAFNQVVREGYQPWESGQPGAPPPRVAATTPTDPEAERVMTMRAEVLRAVAPDLTPAAELYARLLEADPRQVFPRQLQLDLANQFVGMGRHETAARAYELYLNTYRNDPQHEEVELLLGLLYARYLDRRQRARELLTAALPRLQSSEQRSLAQSVLAEISA
ncbi:MAG: rhomboid family intramembrane serine protease [Planctomycetota bacterium]|nr:rhomboid family intramembrane serine protease [Planctomycetota bacterium]